MTDRTHLQQSSSRNLLEPDLVLAAIERAGEENQGPAPDAAYDYHGPAGTADCESIARHLGGGHVRSGDRWTWRGVTAEQVRSAAKKLCAAGLATEHRPAMGRVHYGVAPEGDARLKDLEEQGELPELPESPRHRAWREKREEALSALPDLRDSLASCAGAALELASTEDWQVLCIDDGYEETHRRPCRFAWHNVGTRVERAAEALIEALQHIAEPEPADGVEAV